MLEGVNRRKKGAKIGHYQKLGVIANIYRRFFCVFAFFCLILHIENKSTGYQNRIKTNNINNNLHEEVLILYLSRNDGTDDLLHRKV